MAACVDKIPAGLVLRTSSKSAVKENVFTYILQSVNQLLLRITSCLRDRLR